MAGRGRNRVPEVRRGQGERRTGADQPEFRAPEFAARNIRSRSRRSAKGSGSFGFADDSLRPPASIGNQPRWPVSQPPSGFAAAIVLPARASSYPDTPIRQPGYGAAPRGPISLTAPGVTPEQDEIDLPPEGVPGLREPAPQGTNQGTYRAPYPGTQALSAARSLSGSLFGTPQCRSRSAAGGSHAAARAGAG